MIIHKANMKHSIQLSNKKHCFPFFFILICLLGCSTQKTSVSATAQSTLLYKTKAPALTTPRIPYRWPAMQSCMAPCWEGITPGISTKDKALKVLEENAFLQDVDVFINTSEPKSSAITWKWINNSADGWASFDGSVQNPVIQRIVVSFPQPTPLNEIVKVYGNPSHAFAVAAYGGDIDAGLTYSIEFYYMDSGFSFTFVNKANVFTKPSILPNTLVSDIQFFAPSLNGLSLARGNDVDTLKKILIPWQGSFDFDAYCKLAYSGDIADYCK